jgi:purine-binding chemotaxis protein CheW
MEEQEAAKNNRSNLLQFKVEGLNYAISLDVVDRVTRMVEYAPLPEAPAIVYGVIRWQGQVVALLNLRKRFRLNERPPAWTDSVIIAHTKSRLVSLAVDSVVGVVNYRIYDAKSPEIILPGIKYVTGVLQAGDELILIHDLDQFLALEEERRLDELVAAD